MFSLNSATIPDESQQGKRNFNKLEEKGMVQFSPVPVYLFSEIFCTQHLDPQSLATHEKQFPLTAEHKKGWFGV